VRDGQSAKAISGGSSTYSPVRNFWRSYKKNGLAWIAAWVLAGIVLMGILGPVGSPFDPHNVGIGPRYHAANSEYLMGTDNLGRDVFSRFLWGARTSLLVGFAAAAGSTLLGLLVGTFAGFFGGVIDTVLMRITELFQVIPRFFLALLAVAMLGPSIWNIILAIGILSWPITARLVRSEFLTQRKRYYVDAARMQGASTWKLIFLEILPNVSGVIVVNSTLLVAQAMLLEAGLSYIGVGDPSAISWGTMLFEAQDSLARAWWMSVFPGLGIFLSVLAINIVGDGLNDVINPRSQDTKGLVL
jgi:peptide/nickel transport system permease protein